MVYHAGAGGGGHPLSLSCYETATSSLPSDPPATTGKYGCKHDESYSGDDLET